MTFRLVDNEWGRELCDALQTDRSDLRIICPFIKRQTAENLFKNGWPTTIQVITRFNLNDFYDGVSDLAALKLLLENGARIRGVRNLHAKLYIFGTTRAILTSANLTNAALNKNHEFGFVAEDAVIMGGCQEYFNDLWNRAGKDLLIERLAEWECRVARQWSNGIQTSTTSGLGDEGVDAGVRDITNVSPTWTGNATQAFVKFFGKGDDRANASMSVIEEVGDSGCHWSCTYPKGKRPRQVTDGAIIFMGRMVHDPNDILIYGRAVGMQHEPGRDDATEADVQKRPWRERWSHYIRVHHSEFVGGRLSNGVSLNELMDALGSNAFESTQWNATHGVGNTDPRKAYRQQPAVELSAQAFDWLNCRMESAFEKHGKLPQTELENLDWPDTPKDQHGIGS